MKKIFVHGLGQEPSSWDKTISYMKNTENIVCPDLAGMLSEDNNFYEDLYGGFAEYCNNFNENLDICGLSLGGVLAINYAIEFPRKVNSLVLIAPQYKMPEKLLKFQNMIFKFLPESKFSETGLKKDQFIELCSSMMKLDFSDDAEKISCSVLIICGEKDGANKRASIGLSEKIKNPELFIIKNSGHEVNIDAPKQLAELLDNFRITKQQKV